MCITKMASKRGSGCSGAAMSSSNNKKPATKKILEITPPAKEPPLPPAESALTKSSATAMSIKEKQLLTASAAEIAVQLGQEKGCREKTSSGKSADKIKKKKAEPSMQKTSENVQQNTEQKKTEPKRPPNSKKSHMEGARKKGQKYKWGQVDRDDFSCNNDKTEFLENAQLTKLMSHADVKALMGGQLAIGIDIDETSCRDTVEEVDSEMQDIVFSPLLVGIAREEEKPYGSLPNSQDQKEKKAETV